MEKMQHNINAKEETRKHLLIKSGGLTIKLYLSQYCDPPSDSSSCKESGNKRMKITPTNPRIIDETQDCINAKEKSKVVANANANDSIEMIMEHSRKMQCWVILKRLMVGRDGSACKQPLTNTKKPMSRPAGFKEIESKLNKRVYSGPQEFAQDMKLLFSQYMSQFSPRSEVYRTIERLNNAFEISWKSLENKWKIEEKQMKKERKHHHHHSL